MTDLFAERYKMYVGCTEKVLTISCGTHPHVKGKYIEVTYVERHIGQERG